jgi:hypothetical protein
MLAHEIHSSEDEIEWEKEESYISLSDLIVESYWFFSDYHGGQWSAEYRALCALGEIFDPGRSSPEKGEVYLNLKNKMEWLKIK